MRSAILVIEKHGRPTWLLSMLDLRDDVPKMKAAIRAEGGRVVAVVRHKRPALVGRGTGDDWEE